MKRTGGDILAKGAVFGVCLLGANGVEAQVPQTVLCSGIEIRQGATKDNGTTTTIEAPSRYIATTETLLEDLARDETTNGTWFNTKARVPVNAKLVAIFLGAGGFSSLSFVVVRGTNGVDVSNILTASATGGYDVNSSIFTDADGQVAPFSATDYHPYTISYDSTGAGGTLKFTVTGLAKSSIVTTMPNAATGIYFEEDTFCLVNGTGGGVDRAGVPFVLSGVTVTASGSAQMEPVALPVIGFFGPVFPTGGPPMGVGSEEFSSGAVETMVNVPTGSFQFIPATVETNQ